MRKTRVLLVNPPEIEQVGFNNPPLALLYLASALKGKKIKVSQLIYKTFTLKDALKAFETAAKYNVLKVLLRHEKTTSPSC